MDQNTKYLLRILLNGTMMLSFIGVVMLGFIWALSSAYANMWAGILASLFLIVILGAAVTDEPDESDEPEELVDQDDVE